MEKLSRLREQIEDVNKQIEKAQQSYDLEKMAELQYGELPRLQQQLEIEERAVKEGDRSLVHEADVYKRQVRGLRFRKCAGRIEESGLGY